MATTNEELEDLRKENQKKRDQIREAERKAEALREMVANDSTKAALENEAQALDVELERAKNEILLLADAFGVKADSIKLPTLRSAADSSSSKTNDASGDAPVAASAKRGQK